MSLYDFDITIIGPNLTPPEKRPDPVYSGFVQAILQPVQWAWNNLFADYVNGVSYPAYDDNTATYNFGDQVYYTDRKVYMAIADNLSGVNPVDFPQFWVKTNDFFIGAKERLKYNSQKIVFEYALNKWFFVSPSAPNQIYISNNTPTYYPFLMGQTSQYSSTMAQSSTNQQYYLGNVYAPIGSDYTIYVPTAVFNAQGTTTQNREQAIRNFADLYNTAGMKYDVVPY